MSFILKMLSAKSDISSKRFNGTIGFLCCIFLGMAIIIFRVDIKPSHESIFETMIYASAIILGATVAEGMFTKRQRQ